MHGSRDITLQDRQVDDFTRRSAEQKTRSRKLRQSQSGREVIRTAGDKTKGETLVSVRRDVEISQEEGGLITCGLRASLDLCAERLPVHVRNNQRLTSLKREIRRTSVRTNL